MPDAVRAAGIKDARNEAFARSGMRSISGADKGRRSCCGRRWGRRHRTNETSRHYWPSELWAHRTRGATAAGRIPGNRQRRRLGHAGEPRFTFERGPSDKAVDRFRSRDAHPIPRAAAEWGELVQDFRPQVSECAGRAGPLRERGMRGPGECDRPCVASR
jgi:hypothetical protein